MSPQDSSDSCNHTGDNEGETQTSLRNEVYGKVIQYRGPLKKRTFSGRNSPV